MSEPTRGAIMREIEHLAKMIETLTDKVNSLDDRMDRVDSMSVSYTHLTLPTTPYV